MLCSDTDSMLKLVQSCHGGQKKKRKENKIKEKKRKEEKVDLFMLLTQAGKNLASALLPADL